VKSVYGSQSSRKRALARQNVLNYGLITNERDKQTYWRWTINGFVVCKPILLTGKYSCLPQASTMLYLGMRLGIIWDGASYHNQEIKALFEIQ